MNSFLLWIALPPEGDRQDEFYTTRRCGSFCIGHGNWTWFYYVIASRSTSSPWKMHQNHNLWLEKKTATPEIGPRRYSSSCTCESLGGPQMNGLWLSFKMANECTQWREEREAMSNKTETPKVINYAEVKNDISALRCKIKSWLASPLQLQFEKWLLTSPGEWRERKKNSTTVSLKPNLTWIAWALLSSSFWFAPEKKHKKCAQNNEKMFSHSSKAFERNRFSTNIAHHLQWHAEEMSQNETANKISIKGDSQIAFN